MSVFTIRYTEPANIAATIIQATNRPDLDRLYNHNYSMFLKHPELKKQWVDKAQALSHAPGPTTPVSRNSRAFNCSEGWEG